MLLSMFIDLRFGNENRARSCMLMLLQLFLKPVFQKEGALSKVYQLKEFG